MLDLLGEAIGDFVVECIGGLFDDMLAELGFSTQAGIQTSSKVAGRVIFVEPEVDAVRTAPSQWSKPDAP